MDAKYLAEIKAREQAATKGPWHEEGWALPNEDGDYVELTDDSPADAAFIAHARADIPALIAEVERLTQARDYIQELYDKLNERDENRSKQIATLKKALELAIDRALPESSYSVKQAITRNLLEECTLQAQKQEAEK